MSSFHIPFAFSQYFAFTKSNVQYYTMSHVCKRPLFEPEALNGTNSSSEPKKRRYCPHCKLMCQNQHTINIETCTIINPPIYGTKKESPAVDMVLMLKNCLLQHQELAMLPCNKKIPVLPPIAILALITVMILNLIMKT